uniref:Uncharacterized protein n=1 Tax=Lepeophtheirus salmonis TaxID=72036 RepID=A0A0K2TK36_LEPSM
MDLIHTHSSYKTLVSTCYMYNIQGELESKQHEHCDIEFDQTHSLKHINQIEDMDRHSDYMTKYLIFGGGIILIAIAVFLLIMKYSSLI